MKRDPERLGGQCPDDRHRRLRRRRRDTVTVKRDHIVSSFPPPPSLVPDLAALLTIQTYRPRTSCARPRAFTNTFRKRDRRHSKLYADKRNTSADTNRAPRKNREMHVETDKPTSVFVRNETYTPKSFDWKFFPKRTTVTRHRNDRAHSRSSDDDQTEN